MDKLANIRSARKFTQQKLADAIGANQATISKIEKGDGNPTLDLITKIAAALRVHPSDLFSRGQLEDRLLTAFQRMDDPQRREAALTVLEAMAAKK